MDLEEDIKKEPIWHVGKENNSAVSDTHLPIAEIKVEPYHVFAEENTEEAGASFIKKEYEIQAPNREFPVVAAVVKSEPHVEKAGEYIFNEEYEIEDVMIETQDGGCNSLVDTLQGMENSAIPTTEKVYSCSLCCKVFKERWRLIDHLPTHTNDTSYPCMICSKVFTHRGSLKNHQTVHSEEKQFRCSICGNSFS
ncbi:zinc finger protein 83 [Anabrus simplex]|uniref:zinc finger protein 83 n=1 Tax=Anabrus simplex TaxID=316456 RepID=UPI0035A27149